MCGISGSGKTVFSQSLERYGFLRVSADEMIWSEYGADFANMLLEQQRQVFAATGDRVIEETIRLVAAGNKVVVDTTMCKRAKRDKIVTACRRLGITPTLVYLRSSYEVLHERLASRTGSGPNDQIIPDSQLRSFCNNFEAPGDDENAIIIDQK